jgi:uronate dehydrogenase
MSAGGLGVLVTGGAGAIGRIVCGHLASRGHRVRSLDRAPSPTAQESVTGNISDAATVDAALAGIDTVVHLAAYPDDADFMTVLLESNIVGVYRVMDGAVRAKVRRVVAASSIQVVNGLWRRVEPPVKLVHGTASTNHYGVTKVFAEEMLRMYATVHGLSTVAVRIGWFPRNQRDVARVRASGRGQDMYLSHVDAARFFACAVESPAPAGGECAVIFATSRAIHGGGADLSDAERVIGYVPSQAWPEGIEDVPA